MGIAINKWNIQDILQGQGEGALIKTDFALTLDFLGFFRRSRRNSRQGLRKNILPVQGSHDPRHVIKSDDGAIIITTGSLVNSVPSIKRHQINPKGNSKLAGCDCTTKRSNKALGIFKSELIG
ncbi:unnamed protein product [Kuraishia capsulata CBS 1993]|uniref:Uncharacterized protein n=1 Tax=Kuraishia capsulata CBS 1993 TaxID=1382522 RepID=W6MW13_9ASCO|nr:uncharacterized protein KUCA_T00002739001 [Kuraishia capsulata CBS 1993]CDK26765.1 unnamed protein product [Kuraishia capsulata CBS 1993]